MLKDLRLPQQAAADVGSATPMRATAAELYERLAADGHGRKDFSAIVGLLGGAKSSGS